MLFDMTYCEVCLDGFSDSKFDYRFAKPICLECGEKIMPYYDQDTTKERTTMNPELSAAFVAILDRYEAREINADEALVYIQMAVAEDNDKESN